MFITIFQLILGTDCLIVSHRLLCVNEYMRAQQKILKKKDVYENVSIALHLFKQHPAAGNLFLEIYRKNILSLFYCRLLGGYLYSIVIWLPRSSSSISTRWPTHFIIHASSLLVLK
jgi:hypothetical protein